MRKRFGLGLALLPLALLPLAAVLAGPSPVAAQAADPTVVLSASTIAVGDTLAVSLRGWPTGPALVEVCGNGAQRGSVDCDVVGAAAVNVVADGTATLQFVVGTPPTPCPCVIRVSSRAVSLARTSPIAVAGLPAGSGIEIPSVAAPVRSLEVTDVSIDDDADPPALFGASAKRRLELRIRNTGTVALSPRLSVAVGDGDAPQAVEVPDIPEIPPGETVAVRATFHLPAFTFGREAVVGRVDGADAPVRFTTSAATTPWGLIIAGALVAYLVLLKLVVAVVLRVRRRGTVGVAEEEPVVAVVEEPVAVPVAVVPAVAVAPVEALPLAFAFDAPPATALVARWDLVGAATPEVVLAALLDAGAPEDAVRAQLTSLPVAGLRFDVSRDQDGLSVIVEVRDADELRQLGSVGQLLAAGAFTDGTAALARRALRFLADASPTPGIPAEPATILATIGACAAIDALGIGESVCSPVELSASAVGVEVLHRHRIPWVATLGTIESPADAALAIVAATMSPAGQVGPALTSAVGHGHPTPDRASAPGAARVIIGQLIATGTDLFQPARSSDHPSASVPRPG